MAEWRIERRPLAAQLRDQIWNMLREEGYQPGDRLPSEQELVMRFGISRGALRESLKVLEEERVILCQHGVGRFVAPDPSGILSEDITRVKSVTELASSLGVHFTVQVLSVREQLADEEVQQKLALNPDEQVTVLERVWRGPDAPIIYSIDIFPSYLLPKGLNNQNHSPELFKGSLLTLLESGGQTRLEYSKTIIHAVNLEEDLVSRIGARNNSVWILLEQTNYDRRDNPILYSKDYHSADKFQFRVLRRRR